MATPAVKAAVAVGTAATVGYAAYQHWSEGKEREAAEEAEAAMKEERRQRWVEAMERAQQQQPRSGSRIATAMRGVGVMSHRAPALAGRSMQRPFAGLALRPGRKALTVRSAYFWARSIARAPMHL